MGCNRVIINYINEFTMNKNVKKFVKEIKKMSQSFEIKGKNHLKLLWKMKDVQGNMQSFYLTIPKTPSCYRWEKNARSKVNRDYKMKNVSVSI